MRAGGDTLGGHGPYSLARLWARLDTRLAEVMSTVESLTSASLLLVVGTTGADATLSRPATATREWVPLLAFTPGRDAGVALGEREGLSDIGATVAENFATAASDGESFYGQLGA